MQFFSLKRTREARLSSIQTNSQLLARFSFAIAPSSFLLCDATFAASETKKEREA